MSRTIMLQDGLAKLDEGIFKANMILEGYSPSELFPPEEYVKYYDCVYLLCVQKFSYDYAAQLYERFKKALMESIISKVLPSLADKTGALLLVELVKMWRNYKVMAKCLRGFFLYLDRHFIPGHNVLSLNDVSFCCFHDLINQDRNEKLADKNLLKNVSAFFLEMGEFREICYYDVFEKAILTDAVAYYSHLASKLLSTYPSADYVMKVHICFNGEKVRASEFLEPASVDKLLQPGIFVELLFDFFCIWMALLLRAFNKMLTCAKKEKKKKLYLGKRKEKTTFI